jgi:hypothetical protein
MKATRVLAGATSPQQLRADLRTQRELAVAFERLDRLGHERGQALARGTTQRRPHDPKRHQYLLSVDPLSGPADRLDRSVQRRRGRVAHVVLTSR